MKPFFLQIFEYNYHFNRQLCDVFEQQANKLSERSLQVFNHILNTQQIWNNRIQSEEPFCAVWQLHPPDEWQKLDDKNYEKSNPHHQ